MYTSFGVRHRSSGTTGAMEIPVHAIVFSKDRALQLELLLDSLADHLRGAPLRTTVLFRASGREFAEGYRFVESRARLSGVRWVAETDFRADLLALVAEIPVD